MFPTPQLRGEGQDNTFPRFHLRAEQNNFKSEQEGRPIFDDIEFVEIISPGQSKSIPIEIVNKEHRERWPAQYEAFKKGLDIALEGTPLEQWPILTPGLVQSFKALNIKTVEHLAGVDDGALQNLGLGAREFRNKARDFLENAKTGAPLERERARADRAEAEVDLLKSQLQDLAGRMSTLEGQKREPVHDAA